MAEQPGPELSARTSLQTTLHQLAQLLRTGQKLGPQARAALADLMDELGRDVSQPSASPAELVHLSESTTELARALRQQHDTGVVTAARDRLTEVAAQAEARFPNTADLIRRMIDALADLGI